MIVKDAIKTRILNGIYLPNQKIHSENELMKEFKVSRHTVRAAIGELVNEGWLYREQGAGTFCAERSKSKTASTNKIKTIAIITTFISNYIFPSIIQGAESILREKGYQVMLYNTNNNLENEKKILETVLSQSVDGIIIEPTKSAFSNPNIQYFFTLERNKIPYIMINAFYDELEPICLVMDDEKGGYIQTEHLIENGHENIVGFFKTDDVQGVKRMKGYIKAHRHYEIPINPSNIINYKSEEKHTKPIEKLKEVLTKNEKPTALVCYNDELALILLDTLRELQLHIPNDISIVGYDDSFLAVASEVKLTSIKHPKFEMGARAAKMIVDLVTGKQSTQKLHSVIYEPELIIRHSTSKH
jgi:GntR family transcriptional regulator of arabinose operon